MSLPRAVGPILTQFRLLRHLSIHGSADDLTQEEINNNQGSLLHLSALTSLSINDGGLFGGQRFDLLPVLHACVDLRELHLRHSSISLEFLKTDLARSRLTSLTLVRFRIQFSVEGAWIMRCSSLTVLHLHTMNEYSIRMFPKWKLKVVRSRKMLPLLQRLKFNCVTFERESQFSEALSSDRQVMFLSDTLEVDKQCLQAASSDDDSS